MRRLEAGVIALLTLAALHGCAYFTPPKGLPVIEDKVGIKGEEKVGTLATTPERRVVVVELASGQFCAEPPADAADNIANTIAAALAGKDTATIEAKAEIAAAFASNVQQLFVRS